jgi:hypothetical protein
MERLMEQQGWNCIYHPVNEMRVVDDTEYERLLETGVWFKHPNEAKQMRSDYEKRLQDKRLHAPKRKGRGNREQTPNDGREPT